VKQELIRLRAPAWELSVLGRIPPLPPHVSLTESATYRWAGETGGALAPVIEVLDERTRTHIPAGGPSPLPPVLFEEERYTLFLEGDASTEVTCEYAGLLDPIRSAPTATGRVSKAYSLDIRTDVGLLRLRLQRSGTQAFGTFEVEIFPKKLDYRNDYHTMLAEISQVVPSLVFDLLARTHLAGGLRDGGPVSGGEAFRIVERVLEGLLSAVDEIARDPRRRLQPEDVWVQADRARRVSPDGLQRSFRRQGNVGVPGPGGPGIVRNGRRLWPLQVAEHRHVTDFDVEENRYVRWLLVIIMRRLVTTRDFLLRELSQRPQTDAWANVGRQWSTRIGSLVSEVQRRLQYDFIADSSEYTSRGFPVALQAHPIYAKAFQSGQLLRKGLHTESLEFTSTGSKTIWLLYEYWCFIAIIDLLRAHADLESTDIISIDEQGSRIVLARGRESTATFKHRKTGKLLRVNYNRLYPTPTLAQQPDTAVHIESDTNLFVFDAKYRVQYDVDYQKAYNGVGPRTDDINTMHRYRDAIVNPALAAYPRMVRGAYVLFPFSDGNGYRQHHFYQSIQKVEIGGLPFLPSCKELVSEKLAAIVEHSIAS
jgi:hypothetical protein